jgi:polyisoprenoid-binding protein YceI
MHSRITLAAAILCATFVAAPAFAQETYQLDLKHTVPTFEVTHLGFSQQRGSFSITAGKVTLDRAAKKGAIDVSIDAGSLVTSPALLKMVKSEEFLNVEKFPAMTYKSGELMFDGDNVTGANGEFTLLGVTRPVALKVTNFKCGPNPFNKKPMCGGEATATIRRSDFGMKAALGAASDEVRLVIAFEGVKE